MDKTFPAYKQAVPVVLGGMVVGLLAMAAFAAQASSLGAFLTIFGVSILVAGSAFAVGGSVGFIFGIPRSLQELGPVAPDGEGDPSTATAAKPTRSRYVGNTSLEQISDWLTKIFVGVGLTQLANVPAGLGALGEYLAPALGGFPTSAAVAPLEIIFFGIGGFFVAYMWTRLHLASLFAESDTEAERSAMQREMEIRAIQASVQLQQGPQASGAFGSRSIEAEGTPGKRRATTTPVRVMWVDDRPWNNEKEVALLREQGMEVDIATSTEDALQRLGDESKKYAVVVSDMGRGLQTRAGYDLLEQMRAKGIATPFIIYAGSGKPERDAEARNRGALGSTNSPVRLFELVNTAIQGGAEQP